MIPKPLLTFKVYPDLSKGHRGFYYTVKVFRTLGELRKQAKENGATWSTRRTLACVQSWTKISVQKGKRDVHHKECGEILLYKNKLGARVVPHECVHAALAWATRTGLSDKWLQGLEHRKQYGGSVGEVEESICYAVGDMSAQIYDALYKHAILT